MWDQLTTIFQVNNYALNNIKVKAPSLLNTSQAIDLEVITNQTFLHHNGYLVEDTVPTLFPFPGAWIENLMDKSQTEAYILNLINS